MHTGNVHAGLAGEVGGEALDVGRLGAVVELLEDHPLELSGDRVQAGARRHAVDEPQDASGVGGLARHDLGHLRVLHLDGDHPPVVADGPVDLGQRRRRCGVLVELGEQPVHRADVGLDHPPDHRRRRLWHAVLEAGELLDVGPG